MAILIRRRGATHDCSSFTVETLVGQRVFALALGYEDLSDHDELRHDPLHVLACKLEAKRSDAPVVGKRSRWQPAGIHRPRREAGKYHKILRCAEPGSIVRGHLPRWPRKRAPLGDRARPMTPPTTRSTASREGRFWGSMATTTAIATCELYIFCGRFLLGAKLRPANIDGAAGAVDEVARIVARIRARWPKGADRAARRFGLPAARSLMAEAEGVAYLFGLAPNARLKAVLAPDGLGGSAVVPTGTGKAARLFRDFAYQTETSWSRPAAGCGQGRAPARRCQSAFRGDQPGQGKDLLTPAALSRRRSPIAPAARWKTASRNVQLDLFASTARRRRPCQPTAPVVRVDGLRAAQPVAPDRASGHTQFADHAAPPAEKCSEPA